jgi:tetratricopeptide (TPR) repeat protein
VARFELLSTLLLLAIGTVGSMLYNWPVQSSEDSGPVAAAQQESDGQSERGIKDPVEEIGSPYPASALRSPSNSQSTLEADKLIDPFADIASPEQAVAELQVVEARGSVEAPTIAGELANQAGVIQEPVYVDFEAIARGDRLLTGGNSIAAYQHYRQLLGENVDALEVEDASLLLRLGLSAELAGMREQSESYYIKVVRSKRASPIRQAWALVGLARIWEQDGKARDAAELLSELSLLYGTSDYPQALRVSVLTTLSRLLQQLYLARAPAGSLATRLEYDWGDVEIEPVLDPDLRIAATLPEIGERSRLKVVQRPLNDFELVLVDVRLPFSPMLEVLDDLQSQISQKLRISTLARASIAGRSIQADAASLSVPVFLDQMLASLGLMWREVGKEVEILQVSEVSVRESQRYQLERVQRVLRQIQLETDSQVERARSLMHEANNHYVLGRIEDARSKYLAAREIRPRDELSAKLYFNAGEFHSSQHEDDVALDQYYRALDQTLAPDMQAEAFSQIGRLELLMGRAEKAIPASARSLRLASNIESVKGQDADALLTLARAYLLQGDPFSANRAIFEFSDRVQDEKSKRMATVFSAYARYTASKVGRGLQNPNDRLLRSLMALKPGDVDNFIDHLLIGRAYYDVGLRPMATAHLELSASQVKSDYWKDRVRFELAEVQFLAGNYQATASTLATSERQVKDALYVGIKTLHARSLKRLGDLDGTIRICRELIGVGVDDEANAVALKILGEAYQTAGDHRAASLCFAGLLPKETTVLVDKQEAGKTSVN